MAKLRKRCLLRLVVPVLLGGGELAGQEPELLGQARLLVEQQSHSQAVEVLREIVRAHPGHAEAHLLLGASLANLAQRGDAVAALKKAMELDSDSGSTYEAAGVAFSKLKEYPSALQAFERAVELNPEPGTAHFRWAQVLVQTGALEEAQKHIDMSLGSEEMQPRAAFLHYYSGELYGQRDLPQEALLRFEEALRISPDYAQAYLGIGVTRQRLLQDDEALEAFQKAVELAPAMPVARYRLGLEYLRRGEANAAVGHLLKAHDEWSGNLAVLNALTRALHRAGRKKEYTAYWNLLAGLAGEGGQSAASDRAGQMAAKAIELEKQGDLGGALLQYRTALEFDPLNSSLRRAYGLLLCRAGRWQEGIDEFEDILRHHPDDPEAKEALRHAKETEAKS